MPRDMYNDGTYAEKNPEWHAQDSDWKASHLCSLLDDQILAKMVDRTVSVAEIGCGYGGVLAAVSKWLSSEGVKCQAVGYDISADALVEAAGRHPDVRFIGNDFCMMDEHHDLGLMVDILEHVDDPASMLEHAKTRFKWILFHIPLDENWYGHLYRPGYYYRYLREDRGHIHYFTKRSALRLLRDAGLRIVRWKYTPWGIELYRPGTGRSAPVVRYLRSIGMRICAGMCVRALGGASLACFCTPQPGQMIRTCEDGDIIKKNEEFVAKGMILE